VKREADSFPNTLCATPLGRRKRKAPEQSPKNAIVECIDGRALRRAFYWARDSWARRYRHREIYTHVAPGRAVTPRNNPKRSADCPIRKQSRPLRLVGCRVRTAASPPCEERTLRAASLIGQRGAG
jgi:hypothetical protein